MVCSYRLSFYFVADKHVTFNVSQHDLGLLGFCSLLRLGINVRVFFAR